MSESLDATRLTKLTGCCRFDFLEQPEVRIWRHVITVSAALQQAVVVDELAVVRPLQTRVDVLLHARVELLRLPLQRRQNVSFVHEFFNLRR